MTDATQCTVDQSILNTLRPTVEKRHTYARLHTTHTHTHTHTRMQTHTHTHTVLLARQSIHETVTIEWTEKASNTTVHLFLTHESDRNNTVFGHTGQRQRQHYTDCRKKGEVTTQQSVKTKGIWTIISYTHMHAHTHTHTCTHWCTHTLLLLLLAS